MYTCTSIFMHACVGAPVHVLTCDYTKHTRVSMVVCMYVFMWCVLCRHGRCKHSCASTPVRVHLCVHISASSLKCAGTASAPTRAHTRTHTHVYPNCNCKRTVCTSDCASVTRVCVPPRFVNSRLVVRACARASAQLEYVTETPAWRRRQPSPSVSPEREPAASVASPATRGSGPPWRRDRCGSRRFS